MDRIQEPIYLLSLAEPYIQRQLIDVLQRIGYRSIEPVSVERWSRWDTDGIIVAQIPATHTDKEKLLKTLRKITSEFVLGLFEKDSNEFDRELFTCCKEVAWWPCHQNELAFRLASIHPVHSPTKNNDHSGHSRFQLIGDSPAFTQVLDHISRLTNCNTPVLIEGETGTGKEMVAHALHYSGIRSEHPFIAVNCGALPDGLVENELFGHEHGAFTDAKKTQEGLITQAGSGTLFLDEVEALSPKGQVILLRYLQNHEYRPLGSNKSLSSNARVIAASNQELAKLCERGEFRTDLFYRLNIINIELPPLRDRSDDVLLLAEYFMGKYRKEYRQPNKYLHESTREYLLQYRWPGNVRELDNFIHRQFLLSTGQSVQVNRNKPDDQERRKQTVDRRYQSIYQHPLAQAKSMLIAQFEQSYLKHAMKLTAGNVTNAARIAGKERRAFDKLLSKHDIDKSRFRDSKSSNLNK